MSPVPVNHGETEGDAIRLRIVRPPDSMPVTDGTSGRSAPLHDADVLNVLTVGHVVQGFLSFRSQVLGEQHIDPASRMLSIDEFVALETLQRRFDRREMGGEQFADGVERLVGDPAPNRAFVGFGFWGAAVRCNPRHRYCRLLRMTPPQRRAARSIFRDLHERIDAARSAAHAAVREELTASQLAILHGPRFMDSNDAAAQAEELPFFDMLARHCRLTPDQQAGVRVRNALMRTEIRRSHERARRRFIRCLSEPQRRLLEVVEYIAPPC